MRNLYPKVGSRFPVELIRNLEPFIPIIYELEKVEKDVLINIIYEFCPQKVKEKELQTECIFIDDGIAFGAVVERNISICSINNLSQESLSCRFINSKPLK